MSELVVRSQYCKAKSVRTFGLTYHNEENLIAFRLKKVKIAKANKINNLFVFRVEKK